MQPVTTGASNGVIRLALGCNAVMAGAMLGAATWTGASTVLVLAVQFLAAAGCQLLLLYGLRNSLTAKLEECNESQELHFWNSVVSILLFALASGIALNEGLTRVASPIPHTGDLVNVAVLSAALLAVGFVAWKIVSAAEIAKIPVSFGEALRAVANPVLGLLLIQNLGAFASLILATVGIGMAAITGAEYADGLATFTIGLILAGIAVIAATQIRRVLTARLVEMPVVQQPALARYEAAAPVSPPPSANVTTAQLPRKNYPPPRKKGGGKHRR